ncbi:mercuric transporter MerT family protein [Citrobacter gillenii]
MSQQNNAKGAGLTLLTAAAAAVTAGLCCVGPLLYLLFGISAAGFAVFIQAEFLRIPLMVLTLGLLLRVFWRLYFSKRLWCTGRLTLTQMRVLYWFAVALILPVLFYPTLVAWFYEVFE